MDKFITFLGIEILFFIKQCPLKFISGNEWWSTKVGEKFLPDLVIFSILSSDILLELHEWILGVAWKYVMYFLVGINTKQFWNIPEEKYFVPFRILNLFIISFVNHFVDIALTFFDSSFSSFLFDVTFFNLFLKSVLFTKIAISLLLVKFACFNLAVKISDVNLLNSGIVIHLSWSWSIIFFQFH